MFSLVSSKSHTELRIRFSWKWRWTHRGPVLHTTQPSRVRRRVKLVLADNNKRRDHKASCPISSTLFLATSQAHVTSLYVIAAWLIAVVGDFFVSMQFLGSMTTATPATDSSTFGLLRANLSINLNFYFFLESAVAESEEGNKGMTI